MKFKASFDTFVYVITAFVFLIIPAVGLVQYFTDKVSLAGNLTAAGIVLLTSLICYLFHPSGYWVDDTTLIINRPLKNVVIPKSAIQKAELLTAADMKWSIRTFGVGGLFGYFGKFTNTKIGNMTWYATQRKNYVLIVTGGSRLILTPDNAEAFLQALGN